jgi:two-component system, NarL family, sensor histidine kinase UhpB
MPQSYHLLFVEDSPDDAELVMRALRGAPFSFTQERVETEEEYLRALNEGKADAVICDYHLPRFDSLRALALLKEHRPETPLIVISHNIGEDAAVEALRHGASDYLLKSRLGRLSTAIEAAVEQGRTRRARAEAQQALRVSELHKRAILNSLTMRIALLDGNGVIASTNQAWENFAPVHADLNELPCGVGDNYLDYLASVNQRFAHAQLALDGVRAVMARTDKVFSLEYELSAGNSRRWHVMRVLPIEGGGEGAVVFHEDVTDRILTRIALQNANQRLQALSNRMLSVQEEERRRISLELHDDVGQSLTALKISLHMSANAQEPERSRKLAECIEVANATLEKLREMALDLHPPQLEQLGLEDALGWLSTHDANTMGISVDYKVTGLKSRLPQALETACYRITQEALSNAARHSQAKQVTVHLDQTGNLLNLMIRDNGVGFDEAAARSRAIKKGSLGLIGMEERAELAGGRLKLRSSPGSGTTITATFPLTDHQEDSTEKFA